MSDGLSFDTYDGGNATTTTTTHDTSNGEDGGDGRLVEDEQCCLCGEAMQYQGTRQNRYVYTCDRDHSSRTCSDSSVERETTRPPQN